MLRFLLAACLIAVPITATAQSMMLVQRPPVYQHGEFARGVLIDQTGTRLELQQQAQFGPDRQVYVLMSMVDESGNIRARIMFDPRTWRAQSVSETEVGKTLTSTCSPDTLYPITLGKVYECTSTIQVNDHVLNSRSRMEFNAVERDTRGRLVGFCATTVEDDSEMKITARVCSSPDGKWVRSMQILEVVQSQKI